MEPRFEFVSFVERFVVLDNEGVEDSLEASCYGWGESSVLRTDDEVRNVETHEVEVVC